MASLKTTSEPVLAIHNIAAVVLGGGTAAGALQISAPELVKVVAPFAVSFIIATLGWVNRKYVSPAWKVAQTDAAKIGVALPDEQVVAADVVKAIDASITPAA